MQAPSKRYATKNAPKSTALKGLNFLCCSSMYANTATTQFSTGSALAEQPPMQVLAKFVPGRAVGKDRTTFDSWTFFVPGRVAVQKMLPASDCATPGEHGRARPLYTPIKLSRSSTNIVRPRHPSQYTPHLLQALENISAPHDTRDLQRCCVYLMVLNPIMRGVLGLWTDGGRDVLHGRNRALRDLVHNAL